MDMQHRTAIIAGKATITPTEAAIMWIHDDLLSYSLDVRDNPDQVINARLIRNCLENYWPAREHIKDQVDHQYIADLCQ